MQFFIEIQDGAGQPSWISKNVDNFRINEAILIKFEQHTPDAN